MSQRNCKQYYLKNIVKLMYKNSAKYKGNNNNKKN